MARLNENTPFRSGELPMSTDLIDLVQNLGQPRVLVVGDLMLDRYVWGDAERISQEAPVILLHADKREERLGGASSGAAMVRASLSAQREQELSHAITRQMRRADIVLISDYDKGVCTPALLAATISTARALDIRAIADPIRGKDYRKYHGCSAMTPNRLEAG